MRLDATPHRFLFLLPLLVACSGTALPIDRRPSPILGAWVMTERSQEERAARADPLGLGWDCELEMEFFEDRTVETCWVNHDHPCDFVRMPYREDMDREPHAMWIGGALQTCIYRRDGDTLELACDEGDVLPRDFLYSIELRPRRVREVHGLESLVGTWTGPAFDGDASVLTVESDGSARLDDVRGRVEVRRSTLDLSLPSGAQKCRYRLTPRRLTLHCRPAEEGTPETIVDRTSVVRTLRTVVYRRTEGP